MENPFNAWQTNLLNPMKQLSEITLNNMEKMIQLQLASTKSYGDIGFRQMRKLADVRDVEQVQEFTWGQIEPLSEVNKQLVSDWQHFVAINNEYKNELKAAFNKKSAVDTASQQPATPAKAQAADVTPSKPAAKKATKPKVAKTAATKTKVEAAAEKPTVSKTKIEPQTSKKPVLN